MTIRKIAFESEGKTHHLRFDINALAALEERTGQPAVDLFASFGDGQAVRFSLLRTIFACGLGDIRDTDAGDIMSGIEGGMEAVVGLITQAIEAAFPDASGQAKPGNR